MRSVLQVRCTQRAVSVSGLRPPWASRLAFSQFDLGRSTSPPTSNIACCSRQIRAQTRAMSSTTMRSRHELFSTPSAVVKPSVQDAQSVGNSATSRGASRKINTNAPNGNAGVHEQDISGLSESLEGSEASDIRGSSSSSTSGSGSGNGTSSSTTSSSKQSGDPQFRGRPAPPDEHPSGPDIRLVLPKSVKLGYYSAYPALTSLLASVPTLRPMHSREDVQLPLQAIKVGPLLGAGRTWTVYGAEAVGLVSAGESGESAAWRYVRATSTPVGDEEARARPAVAAAAASVASAPPLVVKLFSPDIPPFPRRGKTHRQTASTNELAQDARDNLRAALAEADMYVGALRPLQGTAVPRYYGLYSGADDEGRWLYALVLERVGRAIHRRKDGTKATWETLLPQQRRAVAALYAQVHAAGVVHGDIELRHVRRELDPFTAARISGSTGMSLSTGATSARNATPPEPNNPNSCLSSPAHGLRLIDFEGARSINGREELLERERRQLDKCIGPQWRGWFGLPSPKN